MSYTIFPLADEKDKEEFLSFWNEFHEEDFNEEYEWIGDNPAGQAVASLLKEDETKNCVGCSVVYPRRFSVNGVNLRAGVARDFFVHEKHRVLGPALKLIKRLISIVQENEIDFIYALPNKNAETVMRKAGFEYLGPYMRMVKIIRTSAQLERAHLPKYLNKLLSPLLDGFLRLLAFETWHRFKGRFRCEEVSCPDERFDRLWMKSRARFAVLGERTSEFLEWKYLGTPNAEHKIFAIFNSDKTELKGYMIYCMDGNSIDVRDFILPEDQKAIRVLVTHFLRHVRKASPNSVVIQFLENREIAGLFKSFGFLKAKCDRAIYYCCNKDVLKKFPVLSDPGSWVILSGEVHY